MDKQILVRVIMNSTSEAALAWKCCNLMDMNLEVQVWNQGDEVIEIRSAMELRGDAGRERIEYFYPYGLHPIAPDEGLSFYCSFDEERFKKFSAIMFEDGQGRKYRARLSGVLEPAEEEANG